MGAGFLQPLDRLLQTARNLLNSHFSVDDLFVSDSIPDFSPCPQMGCRFAKASLIMNGYLFIWYSTFLFQFLSVFSNYVLEHDFFVSFLPFSSSEPPVRCILELLLCSPAFLACNFLFLSASFVYFWVTFSMMSANYLIPPCVQNIRPVCRALTFLLLISRRAS